LEKDGVNENYKEDVDQNLLPDDLLMDIFSLDDNDTKSINVLSQSDPLCDIDMSTLTDFNRKCYYGHYYKL
jgi:hypothetical protein